MKIIQVDQYISKSAEFARPILEYLRDLVHEVCPEAEEAIKWGFPNFMLNGKALCYMASFKNHISFGFRNASLLPDPEGILHPVGDSGMGSLGKISRPEDLPPKAILKKYLHEAVEINHLSAPKKKTESHSLEIPADLIRALASHPAAENTFNAFTPSHRKEYVEWINEAKKEETRQKRIAQTLELLSEGKSKNRKYRK